MQRLIKIIVPFIIFPVIINAVTVDDIIKKLEANANKIKDMQTDVEMRIKVGEKTETHKLRIMKKGKDKMKMEILSPIPQTTITRGKKSIIKTPDGRQITVDKDSIWNMYGMKGLGVGQDIDDFFKDTEMKIISSKGNIYTLEIVPKASNSMFQKAEITVDYKKGIVTFQKLSLPMLGEIRMKLKYTEIKGIQVLDKMETYMPMGMTGETIKIITDFKNIKINKGIKDKEFEIK